jgi:aspartyl/asparaginyl beta-hydroxylase (cupin superfamily)
MSGQTMAQYRSDKKRLERFWCDDSAVTDPLNKFVHSISVVSEGRHCSRHIPI